MSSRPLHELFMLKIEQIEKLLNAMRDRLDERDPAAQSPAQDIAREINDAVTITPPSHKPRPRKG